MSGINYIDEALSIFRLVTSKYTNSEGVLITRCNAEDGTIIDPGVLTSDFGDYIQNFYYLGKVTGDRGIQDWSIGHLLTAARHYQHSSGFFITNPGSGSISIRENGDTLEGLSTVFCLSERPEIAEIIDRFINGIRKYQDGTGFVPVSFWGWYKSPFASSDYSGNFIEELAVLAGTGDRPDLMDLSDRLLNAWINTRYFETYGLFPVAVFRKKYLSCLKMPMTLLARKNPFDRSSLVKSNTNIISGMIELYRNSGTELREKYKAFLDHWSSGVERYCGEDGYYHGIYNFRKMERQEYSRPLPDNHHVLSAYADIYHATRDEKYLTLLKKGCDFWLSCQQETGFFPESPGQTGHKASRALMDSNLDISIVFIKAAELLRQQSYLTAARRCIDAIVTFMKRPCGYIESVTASTGESSGNNRTYVKYITLLVKGFLIIHEVSQGQSVYGRDLYLLARDR